MVPTKRHSHKTPLRTTQNAISAEAAHQLVLTHTKKDFLFRQLAHSLVRLFDCYWLKLNITQIQLFIRNMNNANMTKANATQKKREMKSNFTTGVKNCTMCATGIFLFLFFFASLSLREFRTPTHMHTRRMSGLALEAA